MSFFRHKNQQHLPFSALTHLADMEGIRPVKSGCWFVDGNDYCATLCVNAVFAVARCLSVHLSVTFVYCIHTAEDIVKLLSQPGSPIVLVFLTPSTNTHFQCEHLQRGRKICGGGKNLRFSTRKWYKIGPWLPWNVNRKS